MKICWDNIEGIRLTKNGTFKKGRHTYVENDGCVVCGENYLELKSRKSKYCSKNCAWIGKNNPKYGLKLTGSKNPNWKGEECITHNNQRIRKSIKYVNWRTEVFKQDNWTCQDCKTRGGDLEAHHIFEFSEYKALRFKTYNGRTLCKECHDKTKCKENEYRLKMVEDIFRPIRSEENAIKTSTDRS